MKNTDQRSLTTFLGLTLVLAGCGGGSDSAPTGRISLGVSDGPVHDAEKVCITFDEIEFKNDSDTIIVDLDPPKKVDLLDFQGANAAPLLISQELPAGQYQWMRLGVDAVLGGNGGAGDTGGEECDGEGSYIILSTGGTHNLHVPSGENNGLKLVSGFTVPVNATANFTAEFDLMKSITAPPGLEPDIPLRPVIRLVNNVEVGTLTGTVSNELASAGGCEPSVFVFDDGVAPNPIDDMADDPVATAVASLGGMGYEYTIGFLVAGDYEVAFTCDGTTFVPAGGAPVSIAVGAITQADFS